jgi:hypothetical protein
VISINRKLKGKEDDNSISQVELRRAMWSSFRDVHESQSEKQRKGIPFQGLNFVAPFDRNSVMSVNRGLKRKKKSRLSP